MQSEAPRKCAPCSSTSQAQAVRSFLECERIALVGVSHRKDHFSRSLLREMKGHGLDVALVNTGGGVIDETQVFERLEQVTPPVEGAYVVTPAHASLGVLEQCQALGIDRVWLHKGAGDGAVSPEAARFAAGAKGCIVVGQCILMYLEPVHWVHKVHKGLKRAMGTLPE